MAKRFYHCPRCGKVVLHGEECTIQGVAEFCCPKCKTCFVAGEIPVDEMRPRAITTNDPKELPDEFRQIQRGGRLVPFERPKATRLTAPPARRTGAA